MAMNIIELIPYGKRNAISRQELLTECAWHGLTDSDRAMRRLIEDARKDNCILNLQSGRGYFRPTKEDLPELKHYVAQEHKRSMAILHNLKMANKLLEDYEHERV